MSPEENLMSNLPDHPTPSAQVRRAAIDHALNRFDGKHRSRTQGFPGLLRLMRRTTSLVLPTRRSFSMKHANSHVVPRAISNAMLGTRYLVAASLAVLVVGSAVWVSSDHFQLATAPSTSVVLKDHGRVGDANFGQAPMPPPSQSFDILKAQRNRVEPALGERVPATPAPPASGRIDALITPGVRQQDYATRGQLQNVPRTSLPDATSPPESFGRDKFAGAPENGFKIVREAPVSTFSITSTRLPIRLGALRSTAMCCRNLRRCERKSSSTIFRMIMRRRRLPTCRSVPRLRFSRALGWRDARSCR